MESNEPKPAFLHNGRHKASEAFGRRGVLREAVKKIGNSLNANQLELALPPLRSVRRLNDT